LPRLRIQFNTVNGFYGTTTPIEVYSAVIIHKLMGIPEFKTALDALVGAVNRIFGAVEIAVFPPLGGTEVYIVILHADIGGIIVAG
jgi:hypothetical protein